MARTIFAGLKRSKCFLRDVTNSVETFSSLMEVFYEVCLEEDHTSAMNGLTTPATDSATFGARRPTHDSEKNNRKHIPICEHCKKSDTLRISVGIFMVAIPSPPSTLGARVPLLCQSKISENDRSDIAIPDDMGGKDSIDETDVRAEISGPAKNTQFVTMFPMRVYHHSPEPSQPAFVAKPNTVRILLSVAMDKDWLLYQLDVKNTSLNEDLEEEVDDIVLFGDDTAEMIQQKVMGNKFEIKDLENLKYFLGMEVCWDVVLLIPLLNLTVNWEIQVTNMLRYSSISALAGLLSSLRSNDSVSSTFWLVHEDLHEEKVIAALEYMSSIVATLEALTPPPYESRSNVDNSYLERRSTKGRFHVRIKRRNGRVRVISEDFNVELAGIKFTSISSEDAVINQVLIPKVQFNLQLSEKELNDRARVVLPFEHQGTGKPIQIYDGRRSLSESKDDNIPLMSNEKGNDDGWGKGEIVYFRDSDDEMPDSDEDPDDDLDI
ncbi:elongator complex protein 5 isoform X2 [Cucumis melo var. makuwa]|uniref:Elongator complex protein 5 n=1 Tax=Cucumis melo var. makuwa TaxID=1194695 RepID=A0A5D3DY45_CUCMM|nr:elongator complex protein 5 isoform X2 [Cucumis melo var. makuwa]TYK28259.1 elongator complex protein 5 isoform X2 [Cucumis melo var. makuwa]